jgi:hypothetical protein
MTLLEAIKLGRLQEFVRQQEERGIVIPEADLDAAIESAIKPPLSKRRTSSSPSRDGSA